MKNIISLFLVIMFVTIKVTAQVSWIAPAWADSLKNPVIPNSKIITEAKKIYESSCWTCHGLDGKGNGPAAKTLKTQPADHTSVKVQNQSNGALYWKIAKGKGDMIPFEKVLSKEQRWKLVCYIRELGKTDLGSKN